MKLTKQHGGTSVIFGVGLTLFAMMAGIVAIDFAMFLAETRHMQSAADSAALSAAYELQTNVSASSSTREAAALAEAQAYAQANGYSLNASDVTFGFWDITNKTFTDSQSANSNITGGYNAVQVRIERGSGEANNAMPSVLGPILGMNNYDAVTSAVAAAPGSVTQVTGLRPLYVCKAAYDLAVADYTDPSLPEVTLYMDNLMVDGVQLDASQSCGNLGPGNFGLSDFVQAGGTPGSSLVRDWFQNGFDGTVSVGENYPPQTGNSLNSYRDELQELMDNETVFALPIYSQTTGNGSNEKFLIDGFVGFKITDFQSTGNNKYMRGHFQKMVCRGKVQCNTDKNNYVPNSALSNLTLVK